MKADPAKMFPVSVKKLKAEDGAPFPLFLFLKKNNKFIPIRLPGDPLGLEKYQQILEKNHLELWVPNNFQEVFASYAEYLTTTGQDPVEEIEKAVQKVEEKNSEQKLSPTNEALEETIVKSEEAELVRDAIEDEELTPEEKAQVLSSVSQDVLRALNQITTRGEAARKEGLQRCKEITDEILMIAAQDSNIYEEIIALRNSQEEIEHSVLVGTVAVMFGLALGYTDDKLLADLTVASIFHDIGLVRVKPGVLSRPEQKWSTEDRTEYEKHVDASVAILKESDTEFHPRVFRMIAEHHENYDGSGFPKSLKGTAIDESSALLHLANLFDRLCTGKQTGTDLSPKDAFDYIYDLVQDADAVQEVNPELVQRIFQFMLTEKDAADQMKEQAAERVKSASKNV
ncbi:MAG: HD domain-containing protein [Oligoflexia bacterium]|nr:HD domain-containing protein [Oligoflexia bacterium]